ncbi:FAD dependent oxidoreductase [Geosmithia morbida]|uniref:FAD dependent oxidoreductase n=1 Tax=Geosmithia morbida TaxID=1094350 RepID=A0A9P4YTA9_9HYPO|nr:FAD dependent oxidoreductase [Geosmithia morbida]KAF4122721.1 FAD dependent oxidoreductase [Geosmithia morbida]
MSGALEGIYEPGVVDPGLPRANWTRPYWHVNPHALANHNSPWPQEVADVVIIGTGITGMALARTLCAKRSDLKIVVLEARTLCSGATGRNGGHIKTMLFSMWNERKHEFGIDEAIKISEFEQSHLEAIAAATEEDGADCDLVRTTGVEAYYDQAVWERDVRALEDMRVHAPHLAALHTVTTDPDVLHRQMRLSKRCVGAVTIPAGSVWPYKWISKVWETLVGEDRVNLQTNTTVHSIDDDDGDDFATVKTERGSIQAKKVVHATNAWMGHLLPEMQPFISPVRVNAVHWAADDDGQSPLGTVPEYSVWYRYGRKDYDYLIQREDGGVVAGRACTGRTTTGDDSVTDLMPHAHLRGFPYEAIADPKPDARIDMAWSGIVGFTQDGLPFVGPLPFPGRSHQFVCGGYHATGMIKGFRTSQAAAGLILGEDLPEDFPTSLLLTEGRVRELRASLDRGNYPCYRSVAKI